MSDTTEVRIGYGPTRKTRKSAQREADAWTNTQPFTYAARPATPNWDGTSTEHPSYTETITTEVHEVEGGFACAYVTTTVTHTQEA